jgi:rhodanese-related sulfurtransferase
MMIKKINIRNLSRRIRKRDLQLVDVMAEEIHRNIHIRGAINIPFSKLDHDAVRKLDPKVSIVTYSIDYECPVSRLAAQKLKKSGFKKVLYYQGGLKEWLEAGLPVEKKDENSLSF